MAEIRLNKALSDLGICSRRDADKLIPKGEVLINGQVATVGCKVSASDKITVCGKDYCVGRKPTRVWMYYKQPGIITTHNDPEGRPTVFAAVAPHIKERVISVGRLDINSEGLLLLTNSNFFANTAESPKTGWKRVYKVRVYGNLTPAIIDKIQKGVTIDPINYAPIQIKILTRGLSNTWCECVLSEGKNREIRKIFNYFGLMVNKLIRIQYGPYHLGTLKPGQITEMPNILPQA